MQTKLIRYDMKSVKKDNNIPFYQEYDKKNISESKVKPEIDYDSFITEDDEPVDNMFSEHQQGLLTESLNTSWEKEEPYIVVANVGIYEKSPTTPIVPDVLLSLDVKPAKDIWKKKNRCYFVSVFGKPPELVIEIVSNKVGNEVKKKRKRYEKMGVKYYIVYDPGFKLYKTSFHAFKLVNNSYAAFSRKDLYNKRIWLDDIDIGLTIKKTKYKGMNAEWLRWCDIDGKILKSGKEKAVAERKRTEAERKRAETEKKKAETERKRAEAAKKNAEAERKRAETERKRAEAAKKNAEAAKKNAEAAKKNAEAERKRAEIEKKRAEAEKKKAETERKRAEASELKMKDEQKRTEAERKRAEDAEKELALLKAKILKSGKTGFQS